MIERVLDALAQRGGNREDQFRTKRAADRIASQRQRQAGHFLPPLAEIDNALQSRLVVGQLAFVNDQSSFELAFEHLRNDLVEGHDFGLDPGSEKLQRQISRGERARHGNALGLDFSSR